MHTAPPNYSVSLRLLKSSSVLNSKSNSELTSPVRSSAVSPTVGKRSWRKSSQGSDPPDTALGDMKQVDNLQTGASNPLFAVGAAAGAVAAYQAGGGRMDEAGGSGPVHGSQHDATTVIANPGASVQIKQYSSDAQQEPGGAAAAGGLSGSKSRERAATAASAFPASGSPKKKTVTLKLERTDRLEKEGPKDHFAV